MKRILTLVFGTVTAILLAAAGQAAEVIGTIVSTDPVANQVVVKTADGRQMIFRTAETTRIQQGGTVVELQTIQPGTQVQVVAEPTTPPAATGTTVVYPLASGIVVRQPASSGAKITTAPRKDVDEDVDIDHDVRIKKDVEVDDEDDD
jgi:hypothetical protein